jgi:hypothetical protein
MRKRIIGNETRTASSADLGWLDLERLAQVEVTSEDPAYSIESALIPGDGAGWRAAEPGAQTIRLLFDKPQRLRQILVAFQEQERPRTQEFLLRWSPDGGVSYREITRQQYNFSPPNTTREREEYVVDLDGVTLLEMLLIPDISGGDTVASLAQLRLA